MNTITIIVTPAATNKLASILLVRHVIALRDNTEHPRLGLYEAKTLIERSVENGIPIRIPNVPRGAWAMIRYAATDQKPRKQVDVKIEATPTGYVV